MKIQTPIHLIGTEFPIRQRVVDHYESFNRASLTQYNTRPPYEHKIERPFQTTCGTTIWHRTKEGGLQQYFEEDKGEQVDIHQEQIK